MSMVVLIGVAGALFIYRVAEAERLNPWPWMGASVLLLLLASDRFPGVPGLIGSQVLLLIGMTVFNMTRRRRW